jgi:hypothetical protein
VGSKLEISYADRPSKDKQLLTRFFAKEKKVNMAGS